MSTINLHNDEIGIKVVYYGPGLGGKTTSLQYMHSVLKPDNRGRLISLATGIDRTLYFDFLPIQLPKIKNFSIRMSMYTVPGQVHYDATRKLVLQGADGVVFVADSQTARHDANLESMENLRDNLRTHGMNPNTVPLVIQYNKRDLPNLLSVEQMDRDLNPRRVPYFETCAVSGVGVFEALKTITKLVLADLKRKGIYQEKENETKVPSIKPPSAKDDTNVEISVPDNYATLDEKSDSHSFEFDTTPPPADPPHSPSGQKEVSQSNSLADAIATHAESQIPMDSVPAPKPLPAWFSGLWKSASTSLKIMDLEQLIGSGQYTLAVEQAAEILHFHLQESGGVNESIDSALLALGVFGGHYVRFKSVLDRAQNGESSRQDALFCLFFLTDVELRLQAAGITT